MGKILGLSKVILDNLNGKAEPPDPDRDHYSCVLDIVRTFLEDGVTAKVPVKWFSLAFRNEESWPTHSVINIECN